LRPRSRPPAFFLGGALGRRRLPREETHEPHQGREAGDHQGTRPRGDGHRLAGSPDRDADAPDQPAHRAPPHAQARSPLASRAAQAGRPPPPVPELPAAHGSRGLPRPHQGAGPQALAQVIGGGSLRERPTRALTQTSTLERRKVEENMAIATERRAEVSVEIGGREITFETGKLAKQGDGAVVGRPGETMGLATAQGRTGARGGAGVFPLPARARGGTYAAGKIPGGFFKREGRPTERAILTARMIDRPIRPLWPKGFKNEVQVICTVLSADMVTGHDILCINGASAALMISPLPFLGPVGAVRIGRIDGELIVNPTLQEAEEETSLDLIVVGTKDGITMVEAGADEIPEDILLEALDIAQREIGKLCEAQEELREKTGKAKWLDPDLTQELEGAHRDQ